MVEIVDQIAAAAHVSPERSDTEVERDNVVTKVQAGEERELAAGDKIRIGEFTVVIISSINL